MKKWFTLLLVPAALFSGQARYARLGEFAGKVEVQLHAADPWIPAERNLALPELAWVRTGPDSRLEVELDDGSAWRLGPESQGEISDYSRLSTGQRITLLSLDHGLAYFTGEPMGQDVMMLVVPGAQVTLMHGARVRVMTQPGSSQISVIEGTVRFSSPVAELDLREGQTTRVEPANPSRFFLEPGVIAAKLDQWSEDRDKVEANPVSAGHVVERYGVADLDVAGQWIQTDDLGAVWKPKVAEGWAPFREGRWRWYDTLGYTWVSGEPWGWLPYHYGRWALKEDLGWVWAPSVRTIFKPGEVYWLQGEALAGWGPLAPGEQWTPPNGIPPSPQPQQFANAHTTCAAFQQGAEVLDPAGFTARPAELLAAATFALALPSPAFVPSRLDATRPVLSVGSTRMTRVTPSVPDVTFQDTAADPRVAPADAGTGQRPVVIVSDAPPDVGPPVPTPPDGIYPPAVTGIVVVNPPDHPDYSRPPRRDPNPPPVSAGGQAASTSTTPSAVNAPKPVARGNGDPVRDHHPPATASQPAPAPAEPAPVSRVEPPRHEHTPAATSQPAATGSNRAAPPPVPVKPPAATPAATPVPRVDIQQKVDKPDTPPAAKKNDHAQFRAAPPPKQVKDQGEYTIYNEVVQDVNATPGNFAKAVIDLDNWSHRYPNSDFNEERQFYYLQAYHGLNRPDKVLETAASLIPRGLQTRFQEPEVALQVLLLTCVNVQRLPAPSTQQLDTGRRAGRALLDFLPAYFAPQNKPAGTSDGAWNVARAQLESVATKAATLRPGAQATAATPRD